MSPTIIVMPASCQHRRPDPAGRGLRGPPEPRALRHPPTASGSKIASTQRRRNSASQTRLGLARDGWLGPPVEVCPETELIAIEASATVRDDARHGLPPRLMAHQPTRFTAAQESKPSPSPGIRITPAERRPSKP